MERTLFVFEGEVREKLYFQSLENAFFAGNESHILVSYKNDIYTLFNVLKEDKDLDPFEVLKELAPTRKNQEELKSLRRDQISQIYLFFDMEPRDNDFSVTTLLEMLQLFDNETEHGKLFISYPMVEAIRDIADYTEYLTRTVSLTDCTGRNYKRLSAERGDPMYQDAKKIDKTLWQGLAEANIQKANYLINGQPSGAPVLEQARIIQAQLDDYLPSEKVSVLSAFPIFLADYFGQKVYTL